MGEQWKAWEREVAKDLGGERTGPRGVGLPDALGLPDGLAPECKYQKRLSLREKDMQQAITNASGAPWGLFLRERQSGRRLVVLPYNYFVQLYHRANKEFFDGR